MAFRQQLTFCIYSNNPAALDLEYISAEPRNLQSVALLFAMGSKNPVRVLGEMLS